MRVNFVLSEVATGLRRNLTMTVAMILTTAISLGLMGTGILIAGMAESNCVAFHAEFANLGSRTQPGLQPLAVPKHAHFDGCLHLHA